MATMIFGLMAGELLRADGWPTVKLKKLLIGAGACLLFGVLVDPSILPGVHVGFTLCPIVKRIWTPSWAVFSTGWTLALLAGFYWLIDIKGYKRWAQPLVVVGMNSIAIYMMGQLMKGWVRQQLETHLGRGLFAGTYGPIWSATLVLLVLWLICFWMYRRKIFLKI
jgi:predicted acyltransferase